MKTLIERLKGRSARYMIWVALCFMMTSAAYLSWVDRLVALAGAPATDWLSMVAGYVCQAAGVGLTAWAVWRRPAPDHRRAFSGAVILFAAAAVPALVADRLVPAAVFGLVMNALCGVIAGYYLHGVGQGAAGHRRGLVFGGGYALATVAVGLWALVGRGALLRGRLAPVGCLVPAAVLLAATRSLTPPAEDSAPAGEDESAGCPLWLACGAVVLVSAVKNLGFGFPSTDIAAGLMPEISRIPYAAGLAAAGLIGDHSRKNGMLCAVAALVIPFIMLGLSGEPVSSALFWGLDYLFFGFFSVFRVVLFLDMAQKARRPGLAPLGLLLGRIGDAAGTAVCIALSGQRVALIAVCALLFFPAVYLLFRLYRRLYEPESVRQRSEQEVFEAFCMHNDLSAREKDILRLIIGGHTNGEIAEALFISENTVKYHVRNVLQKTGCRSRVELQKKYTTALYPQLADGAE